MRDFDNWWTWHQRFYPDSDINVEQAILVYDRYYSCTCESCLFRKEHGLMPIKVNSSCSVPLSPLGRVDARNNMMHCEFCGSIEQVAYVDYIPADLCYNCRSRGDAPIVCLCGSTRFADDFKRVMLRETLAGKIVLSVGTHERIQEIHDDIPQKQMLDWLHMQKIQMAWEVIIINKDDYIGESTARELGMATKLGKPVKFEYPHYG